MKHILAILLLAFISFNCEKNASDPEPLLPTVNTAAATSITANTALSGGTVTAAGGPSITARGVCWGTASNPTVAGNHTTDGNGNGVFASAITGLTPNTIYYVRAYATNIVGTTYGNEISFTTTASATALPTVTTTPITDITMATAASGGNVTADGGAAITARGVCWSTTANPTIALSTKTTDGTGMGIFTSAITGLTAATIYHVRAYASNSVGTSYGGDSIFTTTATSTIPTITTTAISALTSITANSGGTISSDGGAAVTARGVCWSTGASPTIALPTKTTDGTGIGTFTSDITGLTKNTTYYVRAYATNSVGTAYGNDVSFTTDAYTVYVAGYEDSGSSSRRATVWKNGIRTILGSSLQAVATSVFVTTNDVYIAGTNGSEALIWKNGVSTVLTSGLGAQVNSVFVDGNDVYAAGNTPSAGILWKNGVPTVLNNGFLAANPQSVFVNGGNAYIAGYDRDVVVSYDAKLWINAGTGTILGGGNNGNAAAFSVFVVGSDVYVTGYESNGTKNLPMVWKNGVGTALSRTGNFSAYGQSVFVVGSDVYVAGYESRLVNDVAIIWKNGIPTQLSTGTNTAYTNSVFVYNGDVYVAGQESSKAVLWKNGIPAILSNGSNFGYAYSVYVK